MNCPVTCQGNPSPSLGCQPLWAEQGGSAWRGQVPGAGAEGGAPLNPCPRCPAPTTGTSIVFDLSLTYILVALVAVLLNNVLVERLSLHTRITAGTLPSRLPALTRLACRSPLHFPAPPSPCL